ncbi:hypothetical protein GIB67_007905 [Kingdonia uniflora]|uniref:Phosphatidylinositol-glycan biosynthesis class F protein n=1 Tax=Kingdonia uniflora TaxID=39325 RepID=A0A7J7PB72_9MAGN|nr:hypothetical protein GIB67_007905 [Kingdonia uniflora]
MGTTNINNNVAVSVSDAFRVHLISVLGLASAIWIAHNIYTINLTTHPIQALRLILVFETPILISLYSCLGRNREQCSYLVAVGRGMLGLLAGAVFMVLGAVTLGAPVGIQYMKKTIYWSLLMSSFTFVPTSCVFGSSWMDWQRLFANTKPIGVVDYMICIPAHGAVIGAWLGAWPMPLDWERPWQEWPVCVSYGALAGYLVGVFASWGVLLVFGKRENHFKGD